MTITQQSHPAAADYLDGSYIFAVNDGSPCTVEPPREPAALTIRMDRHEARHIVLALVTQLADPLAACVAITVVGSLWGTSGVASAQTVRDKDGIQ